VCTAKAYDMPHRVGAQHIHDTAHERWLDSNTLAYNLRCKVSWQQNYLHSCLFTGLLGDLRRTHTDTMMLLSSATSKATKQSTLRCHEPDLPRTDTQSATSSTTHQACHSILTNFRYHQASFSSMTRLHTSASLCSLRYAMATSAPSRAYASATALPMPLSAPVISAFCTPPSHLATDGSNCQPQRIR